MSELIDYSMTAASDCVGTVLTVDVILRCCDYWSQRRLGSSRQPVRLHVALPLSTTTRRVDIIVYRVTLG